MIVVEGTILLVKSYSGIQKSCQVPWKEWYVGKYGM